MSDRSIELARQSISGSINYDYFIVGVGAATFSYFGKDFKATESLGYNEGSLIIFSLLCLALSVVFGLKKIEINNTFMQKNGKYLDYSEHLATYRQNALEGGTAINVESGEILTPEDSAIKAAALKKLLPEWKSKLEKQATTIRIFSLIRDYSMFFAYIILAISKIMPIIGH